MVELVKTRFVAIGDVVQQIVRADPSKMTGGDFTYVDLGSVDQDRKVIRFARPVSSSEAPSRARQVLKANDVLVSTVRPNLNGVARVPAHLDGSIASTGFCVLRPKPEYLDSLYLFHWVQSSPFVDDMIRKATGASYPAVSDKLVLGSCIPLPPLDEQRRIAAILDKAEELRTQRRQALAHLDALTHSIFDSMFGDLGALGTTWPRYTLGELGRVSTGKTPPGSLGREAFGDLVPFVTPGDLGRDSVKRRLSETGTQYAPSVSAGSLLVCCIGATIGKMAMAAEPSSFNQQINAVEWGDRVDPYFGLHAVSLQKHSIVASSSSTTMPILNKSSFTKISIVLPPTALQEEFANQVRAIDRAKTSGRVQLAELDALFASLQHRAFKGQL